MSDHKIRTRIEEGAQQGNGACLIAYAVLELARAHGAYIANAPDTAAVGDKIAKAVEICADRLAEISDTILVR